MNNHSQQQDRLDRAVVALRETQPATGLSEELLERTIAMAGAGEEKMGSKETGWWTMKMVKRTAWATGLAAAATGLCWMIFAMNGHMAFGDVVERVNAATMLRCKMSTEVNIPGQGKVTQTGDVIMSQTWFIMHMANVKMIMDNEKRQMISLTEMTKQAIVMNLKNAPAGAQPVNILDTFRKFDAKASMPLGEMQIDGKPARGFEITQANLHMKVWADLKTELPVRIEMIGSIPMMPDTVTVMTDFDWNPTVTPEEISLEIPKDYAVTNANMDASIPSEADVINMLSRWVELNGGKFPEKLTFTGFIQLTAADMAKRQAAETAGMTAAQKQEWLKKMTSEMMNKMMPLSRGLSYIGIPTSGSDWQYAGSGVEPGAKGIAILWYKPANAAAWRVIDADMTVHDATEAPAGGVPVSTKDINPHFDTLEVPMLEEGDIPPTTSRPNLP